MNNFYSKARNMSTGHKGSTKTALTSALKISVLGRFLDYLWAKTLHGLIWH